MAASRWEAARDMFAFLFGKKPAAACLAKEPVLDETDLEKKIRQLERIKESHRANAVEHGAKGQKAVALQFLKREKLVDEQLAATNNMLLAMVQQRGAVEQATLNRGALGALAAGHAVVQQAQQEWSAERVADLMDSMEDARAVGREINDLIGGAVRFDMSDEELLAQLTEEEVAAPVIQAPVMPAPPTEEALLAEMLSAPGNARCAERSALAQALSATGCAERVAETA